MNISEEVNKVHQESLLFELHSDFPVDLIRRKRAGETDVLKRIWIPKIKKGGVNATNLIVGGDTDASGKSMEDVIETLVYFDEELETNDQVRQATTVKEIKKSF